MNRKKRTLWLFLGVTLCLFTAGALLRAQALPDQSGQSKLPLKAARVAYCESGEFANYASTLAGLAEGLQEAGLIGSTQGLPYQDGQSDSRSIWNWLAAQPSGAALAFVPDGYYSFAHRSKEEQTALQEEIIERLNRGDIDLLIVMGTQAGQALANNRHHVPTFIFSTSNAVQAGIISSATDSGYEHVWAHMDPARYQRQLEVFHDLIPFKKLGLVYEPSLDGRAFAAVADVESVAEKRGFTLVRAFVSDRQANKETFRREMLAAHQWLADQGVDAVYSTLYFDRDISRMAESFAPLYAKKIPVFAQQGAAEVRAGALLSVSRADFRGIGRFGAQAMREVLQGKTPRQLAQVYENTPNIVLNMEVAEKIAYAPSFDILLAADRIYSSIDTAK
ncbi:ABC transporter substrate binding protein [Azotosporobacter soli]|uniref:ABC transporter substrate binding protein n=1 Tax=Azotosporobacter soli TaxID=3055040 RepID=UPI0031FF173A